MLLATFHNVATREKQHLHRCNGATAPAFFYGVETVCGYWESRFELFYWGCDVLAWDPHYVEWVDGYTGEILNSDDLESEYFDMIDELESE